METAATQPKAESAPPAGPAIDASVGESVYNMACMACHTSGVAGAPKLGDKDAWNPRLEQGWDALVHNAIKGKGSMPPKGGRMDLSDGDITNAVGFMLQKAGLSPG